MADQALTRRARAAAAGMCVCGMDDARLAGLVYFASATRDHYYFDGNKRTALMALLADCSI